MFYTSMPIIILGIFDKDVDATAALRYGQLYAPGRKNQLFNRRLFMLDAILGGIASLVLAGVPAGT
jgi:magnesium-transporting ATPase (P-type)